VTDPPDQLAPAASVAGPDRSPAADSAAGVRFRYHRTLLLISLAVLALAALLPPPVDGKLKLPFLDLPAPELCAWKRTLGWDCPGCGLTRCFVAMAHGRWAQAWGFHPLGTLLFLVVAAQIPFRAWQMRRIARGRHEWRHPALAALPWILLAALLGQWAWKTVSHFT